MKPYTVLVALISLTLTAAAARTQPLPAKLTGSYSNDPAHTRFLWKIRHLGLSTYTARINDVSMQLQFDATNQSNSTIAVVLDPRTVDTAFVGDKDFNAEIYGPDILKSEQYPSITFTSTNVVPGDNGALAVSGDLTLLGVTRPLTLDVTLTGSRSEHPFAKVPALGFHATGVVDRRDFGLDFLVGTILGEDIFIEVQTEFIQQ